MVFNSFENMKKILFIEDDSALQKTFKEILTYSGYEMLSALDGEEGLKVAKEQNLDLILLDLILPRKNGFEVLKELKENEKTKSIPVIILTHLENPKDIQRALELGATTYLVKADYTLEEVVKKIKEALGE